MWFKAFEVPEELQKRRYTSCKKSICNDGAWFILDEQTTSLRNDTKVSLLYLVCCCENLTLTDFHAILISFIRELCFICRLQDKKNLKKRRKEKRCCGKKNGAAEKNEGSGKRTDNKKNEQIDVRLYIAFRAKNIQIYTQTSKHVIECLVAGHLIAAWKWLYEQLFDGWRCQ